MTIEELNKAIEDYCTGKSCSVDGCPLYNIDTPYGCSGDELPADVVKKHYKLIFGETEPTKDNVNHPSHYETGKFECIDVMLETQGVDVVKGFCLGNGFKYVYRHRNKGGCEDLKKGIWYLNKYIELTEGGHE